MAGEILRTDGACVARAIGLLRNPGFITPGHGALRGIVCKQAGSGELQRLGNLMDNKNVPSSAVHVPGMAGPGVPNAEVIDFVARNRTAIERAVTQRMRQVGVPEQLIGMRGVPGVEEGAFTRYPGPQGGGNIRPDHPNVIAGRWQAGINVDEAIFDPTFRVFEGPGSRFVVSPDDATEYHEAWARASSRTRLDAAISHEYEELRAVVTPELEQHYGIEWPHFVAVANAPETALTISNEARELLRSHRRAMGLE